LLEVVLGVVEGRPGGKGKKGNPDEEWEFVKEFAAIERAWFKPGLRRLFE
jgi:hypothetical protein